VKLSNYYSLPALARHGVEIEMPDLHPGQLEVVRSSARYKVVCAGRRWRKSSLGVLLAIERAFQGGHVWWVSPDFPRSEFGWRLACGIAAQFPGVVVRQATRTLQFRHGHGWLAVKSVESGGLFSEGLDFLVCDEAAHYDKGEDVWMRQLRPTLSDRRGSALFITTPKGDNWFRTLFERARTPQGLQEGWQAWQFPTSSNPYIDKQEIEDARSQLPSWIFAQEYLAEFTVPGGGIFKSDWFRYYQSVDMNGQGLAVWLGPSVGQGERHFIENCDRYATVDLATSTKEQADYTVIACWARTGTGKLVLLDVLRARLEGPDIPAALLDKVQRWSLDFVAVESVGYQLSFVQDMRRRGVPVRELTRVPGERGVSAKVRRALPATLYFQGGQVWFPRGAAWLAALERELTSFNGVDDAHDDQVDAVSDGVEIARGLSAPQGSLLPANYVPESRPRFDGLAPGRRPW
jgi:predicted phage terminase large subunit-like protein